MQSKYIPSTELVFPTTIRCTTLVSPSKILVIQVITSDGAVVEVGADIFFRVKDPVLSVSSIQDLNHSLRIIAVASLQKHLSKLRLNHIESDKAVTSSLLHVS